MNGLYVRADTDMIDATRSAMTLAVPSRRTLQASGRRSTRASRAASAGSHGVDPIAPAASASHTSGVRYQPTVYGVAAAGTTPAIALKKPIAAGSVSARKNTQPS